MSHRLPFCGEGPSDTGPFTSALLDAKRQRSDDLADSAIAELRAPRPGSLLAAVTAQAEHGGACRELLVSATAFPSGSTSRGWSAGIVGASSTRCWEA